MTNPSLLTERPTIGSAIRRQAARLWRAIGVAGARRDPGPAPSAHVAMLEDAMQSLGDGVALYGPDDCLVWCNRRFRELRNVNPLSCQVGAHFGDILRSAIASGEVPVPPEGVEAWVRMRLDERRQTLHSKIQYRNGRWLRVTDRRTPDGSIISIHSDVTDLKAAEAAAEVTRARLEGQTATLSTLIENVNAGVILVGADGRFAALNRAYGELWGLPTEVCKVGATFASAMRYLAEHGDFPNAEDVETYVAGRVVDAMSGGPSEHERTRPNGRVVQVRRRPLPGGGFVGTFIDVTEARQREAEISEARARLEQQAQVFSTLIENLQAGVVLVDADGRFMALNRAFATLYELPPGRFKAGDTFESFVRYLAESHDFGDVDIEATVRALLDRAMGTRSYDFERKRPNGRTVEVRRVPLPAGGFVSTYIDVTEARRRETEINQARAQLEHQAEVLSTLIENLQAGVTLVDANGRFMALNQAYLDLYDIPRGTFKPGDAYEACIRWMVEHGDFTDGGGVDATVRRIVERAMRPEPQQLERTRANGRVIDIRRVPLPSGGFVTTYIDVTEARRREADLTEARTRLERQTRELAATMANLQAANAAKSTFLANMSHELRTPLNAILGFAEVMRDAMLGPLDARYRDYAKDVHVSGSYLLRLINDILDTSKIDAGQMQLEREPIDLVELIAECERLVLERARTAGVAVTYEIAPQFPLIAGDRLRLKQALLNLVVNAVKFTPSGGSVRLSATASARDGIEIVIADTGIGMEPKHIARALEPFQQLDNRLARRYEGTGLGLPLAKSLIELHGGKLTIDSAPGRGTTARIWLPPERVLDGRPPAAASKFRSHR